MLDMLEEVENELGVDHTFDSGTLEGLMKGMIENNNTLFGVFDELATFNDGLDKGSNGVSERSRFLTLFNGGRWKKKRKVMEKHVCLIQGLICLHLRNPTMP